MKDEIEMRSLGRNQIRLERMRMIKEEDISRLEDVDKTSAATPAGKEALLGNGLLALMFKNKNPVPCCLGFSLCTNLTTGTFALNNSLGQGRGLVEMSVPQCLRLLVLTCFLLVMLFRVEEMLPSAFS